MQFLPGSGRVDTTSTLTKLLDKKLDDNYTRMLRAILNNSWRQHPTRHQLYGHLTSPSRKLSKLDEPDMQDTAGETRTSSCDILLWTPSYGRTKVGWLAITYIHQLCENTGCSPEDLPGAMNDKEKWRERIRDIRASGTTWWWWWWYKGETCRPLKVKLEEHRRA